MNEAKATSEDVVRIFGDIEDEKVVEVLATGATVVELEQAAVWLAQESDVMGAERRALSGNVAQVYAILATETDEPDRA